MRHAAPPGSRQGVVARSRSARAAIAARQARRLWRARESEAAQRGANRRRTVFRCETAQAHRGLSRLWGSSLTRASRRLRRSAERRRAAACSKRGTHAHAVSDAGCGGPRTGAKRAAARCSAARCAHRGRACACCACCGCAAVAPAAAVPTQTRMMLALHCAAACLAPWTVPQPQAAVRAVLAPVAWALRDVGGALAVPLRATTCNEARPPLHPLRGSAAQHPSARDLRAPAYNQADIHAPRERAWRRVHTAGCCAAPHLGCDAAVARMQSRDCADAPTTLGARAPLRCCAAAARVCATLCRLPLARCQV